MMQQKLVKVEFVFFYWSKFSKNTFLINKNLYKNSLFNKFTCKKWKNLYYIFIFKILVFIILQISSEIDDVEQLFWVEQMHLVGALFGNWLNNYLAHTLIESHALKVFIPFQYFPIFTLTISHSTTFCK
jgi:hypothetical protein